MKKIKLYISLVVLVALITSCSGNASASTDFDDTVQVASDSEAQIMSTATAKSTGITSVDTLIVAYDEDDLDTSSDMAGLSEIELQEDTIAFEGSGATVENSVVTITAAGRYRISGTLNDGQVIVDTEEEDTVFLLFNGIEIHSSTSTPIYVRNAEKVVITLVEGTENVVTDGDSYVFAEEDDEPNAAIFSNDDLTINGSGSLTVNANYRHGIASDDDLKIVSGIITVNAVRDGIKGRDSISVRDGTIMVQAGADALQADNDEDADKGYILIEGG